MTRALTLERFASAPERLRAAAERAGRPPAGAWSATEIVSHLVAVERAVWQARLATLEHEAEPTWTPQEPGLAEDLTEATLDDALHAFADERIRTVATVTGLDDGGWARAGNHTTYGRLDIEGLLRVAVDHDEEHLASIRALG